MRIKFALPRTWRLCQLPFTSRYRCRNPVRVKHLARGDLIIGPPSSEQRTWQTFSVAPVFPAEYPTTLKANFG